MTSHPDRPWLALYPPGASGHLDVEHASILDAFAATAARRGTNPAIRYFDGTLTFADLDARSTAFAAALAAAGLRAGDRVAIYTQNVPGFVVALVGTWKAGCIGVPVNPMNKQRELSYLLTDSGASVLVCLEELWESVARLVVGGADVPVRLVVTISGHDDQQRDDPRVLPTPAAAVPTSDRAADQAEPGDGASDERTRVVSMPELLTEHAGEQAPSVTVTSGDVALLTYTSGTTGQPKGATNTHGNLAFNAQVYRDWMGITHDDVILGVAPLFHITGLVGHLALSLLTGASLVLAHRFSPDVIMDAVREHRPTFTVGAVTALNALIGLPDGSRDDWSSFRIVYSGGAAIAPAVTDRFEAATGLYIHNIYGLTETTSPSHAVPLGTRAPVDPDSGALSVGIPVYDTTVRIIDDQGRELEPGQVGEIATRGPQVVSGYWNRPEATAEGLPDGELRTGDVGFMTRQGWFFVVDRKKDMINASGYKVWPREVEDVLYGHEAVREVAVVGVPDDYRGETVKAFVSLTPGASVTPEELVAWSKERMAAYKYPRSVEIVDELPKTTTGKILRRELRA